MLKPWLRVLAAFGVAVTALAQERPSRALTQKLEAPEWGFELLYPEGWQASRPFANALRLTAPTPAGVRVKGRIVVTTEKRLGPEDAVERLGQVATEWPNRPSFLVIDGWPALQRRQLAARQLPGPVAAATGRSTDESYVLRITTAIAAGGALVRIEGTLEPDAEDELAAEVEAIGRAVSFTTKGDPEAARAVIERISTAAAPRSLLSPGPPPTVSQVPELPAEPSASPSDQPGVPVRAQVGGSEISVAVSTSGQHVVVATNSGYSVSSNGGVTFGPRRTVPVGTLTAGYNGDPSLALGQSGSFYYALIGFPSNAQNSTAIWRSTDNGQNFTFRANAVVCPNLSTTPNPGECFADQEHIAADRWNAAVGGDQVYSTWRNFDDTDQDPALVCSQNSATNWTAPINVGTGVKPRLTVGQDGFVYVVWLQGSNVMVHKYSSCASGLAAQAGFPRLITGINEVTCPVPGLDRCTGRNTLASYTLAVDDTNANHVYAAFATNTSNNVNENVQVLDSTDGGATWPRSVQVNAGVNARRFMPWLCTVGGTAHVTWYDRRLAGASTNDLTDFYRGSAFVSGSSLVSGPEVRLTDTSDAHCASGWPCATDRVGDAEGCFVQPQPAGVCKLVPTPNPDTSSNARCDFSDCGIDNSGNPTLPVVSCPCGTGERCVVGRGCPKYGDYNYSYCAAGRVYSAWASATAPSTLPANTGSGIDTFVDVALVCCVPRIQAPAAVALPATCAGSAGTSPLKVCNTGAENLNVTSIASSNAQFSTTDAYPQVIPAGACHDFTVRFAPSSRGPKSATLTINSNDTVNPAVPVSASGLGKGMVSITCPADRVVGNDPGLCSALVNVGTPAVDAEGCPVTITSARSDGLSLVAPYPVGNTLVDWTAKDGGDNAKACTQSVTVNDIEPPVIVGLGADPNSLWPPNHKMRTVAVSYTVTDNCDALPAISCGLAAASNEPVDGTGDGDTSPDWQILGPKSLLLRAERSGGGSGRIYTLTAACTDTKNNSSSATTAVTAQHDRR